ncbi:MAG: hypothetical protein ABIP74_00765 [Candidatus Saccharimonas sp.]
MVTEKLEFTPMHENVEGLASSELAYVLRDLGDSYHDLHARADSIEVQLREMSIRIAKIEKRFSRVPTPAGLQVAYQPISNGDFDNVSIIPLDSNKPEQSSIELDLDTVTFESAEAEPHMIDDEHILKRKKDVWKMVGGGIERFHNGIYNSLVETKVDESDISFMKLPHAEKIFPQQLEMLRQRWLKKSRGLGVSNTDKAYTNIYEQQGTFTHFHSDAFMHVVASGGEIDMDSRFYLNPRLSDSVRILERTMNEANRQGLVVSGKINGNQLRVYPEFYRKQKNQYDSGERDIKAVNIRTDNIVMYCTAEDRDKFLKIIKGVYVQNQMSFAGRRCPTVPFQIADGFAIGEEPKGIGVKESLTGLIAKVVRDAMVEADTKTWLQTNGEVGDVRDDDWLREVHKAWSRIAVARGVNLANIAFRP